MRRGVTLLEAMVILFLSAVLLGTLTILISSVARSSQRIVNQAGLDQEVSLVASQLVRDVQRTNASGLTFRPATASQPLTLAIHPLHDVLPDASLQYASQEAVAYFYYPERQRLVRRLFNQVRPCPVALPPDEGKRFSDDELARLEQEPAFVTTFSWVDHFALQTDVPSPAIANPLRFRLRLKRQTTPNATEEASCIRSIWLRNTL